MKKQSLFLLATVRKTLIIGFNDKDLFFFLVVANHDHLEQLSTRENRSQ